jgi:hypothetical protein
MSAAPNDDVLLRVWEQNHGAHPIRRALALLNAAWPEVGMQAWAQASIGERDGCLLSLYETLFGAQLQTIAHCPRCGERLETSFTSRDIRVHPPALPVPRSESPQLHWREQGYELAYRLPNSEDLLQITDESQLLRRCVVSARHGGTAVEPGQLPPEVVEHLMADMARQDPDAEVLIGLTCPACQHAWRLGFDIVSHLWGELEDWVQRTLADVHGLACAYGWAERDILAMSATRRQLYLDMVRA